MTRKRPAADARHARARPEPDSCETFDSHGTDRYLPSKGRSTEYRFLDLQDYRITIFESVVLINLDLESAWYLTKDHAVDSRSDHSTVASFSH